jgi:hypothetical protein
MEDKVIFSQVEERSSKVEKAFYKPSVEANPKNNWTFFLVVGTSHSNTLATFTGSIMMES